MAQKGFKYRLEKVLELKRQREEEEKKKLKQLMDLEAHERAIKIQLETTLVNVQEELKTRRLSGLLNIEELRWYPQHIKSLEQKIKVQELRLIEIAAKIIEQRENVAKAVMERKGYEKHKEKTKEAWQFELDQTEARLLDELATVKFARESAARQLEAE